MYPLSISTIQAAKREKSAPRDETQSNAIYKAVVKRNTKVSEFKWHLNGNVTKLIDMIIIEEELVRNTR